MNLPRITIRKRQATYCEHRARGLLPAQAAEAAGYSSAYIAGYRLEKQEYIQHEIARLLAPTPVLTVGAPPPELPPPGAPPMTRGEALSLLSQLSRSERVVAAARIQAVKLMADLEKWVESGVHVGVQINLGNVERAL